MVYKKPSLSLTHTHMHAHTHAHTHTHCLFLQMRLEWHRELHFIFDLKHEQQFVWQRLQPPHMHFTKPCPPQLDCSWTAFLIVTILSVFISCMAYNAYEHTSNWFLAYFPCSTPVFTAIVYNFILLQQIPRREAGFF